MSTVRLSLRLARTALAVPLTALVAASTGTPPPAAAQAADPEAQHCVSLRRVDRTSVVSDRTILFYMKDGNVLRNELPSRCPTLLSEHTFMYRTMLDQLCSVDTITVLTDVGFGFTPGPTCMLGEFEPISPEQGAALEREADER
jgi:hypothetical protein